MNLEIAKEIALESMKENGLLKEGWTFAFNNRHSSFGLCSYRKKQIQLSKPLTAAGSEDGVFNTVVHEVAHALTRGHHHDEIWRKKFIELGGNGATIGTMENQQLDKDEYYKNFKWFHICPVCGQVIPRSRKPQAVYACGIRTCNRAILIVSNTPELPKDIKPKMNTLTLVEAPKTSNDNTPLEKVQIAAKEAKKNVGRKVEFISYGSKETLKGVVKSVWIDKRVPAALYKIILEDGKAKNKMITSTDINFI